jgi:hypothetical protein
MPKVKINWGDKLSGLDNADLALDKRFKLLKALKPLLTPKNLKTSLEKILTASGVPARYAALIREIWEARLLADIRKIALLQYLHLQKTGDWGDLGEQRIIISYCRHLLQIPAEQEVSFLDVEHFQKKIQEMGADYAGLTAAELRRADEAVKCDLLYKRADYSREQDINQFLEFLGSAYGVIAGQLGIYRSVIAGEVTVQKTEGYRISTFQTELARTPANVLSIAAVVGGRHVAIRLPSCETIFANKWLYILNAPPEILSGYLQDELENIGLSFKLRALAGYQVSTRTELLARKPEFLREMLAGLQWHELGHGIVINDLLDVKDSAFGEALAVLGANIIAVFKEALADWAPARKTLQGPLHYFCGMAEQDPHAAGRQISVYLSDNWFLGEQDDNSFANHSEIMAALLLKYIGTGGQVDFAGLGHELSSPQGIFYYILAEYKRISAALEQLIKSAQFDCAAKKMNFAGVRKIYTARVRKLEKEYPVRSLEFQVYFWAKILEDMQDLNAALLRRINEYLALENQKFHKFLLDDYLRLGAYPDLRSCVCGELKKRGFYAPLDKPELPELLRYFQV